MIFTLVVVATAAQAALPSQVADTPVPSLAPMVKKVSPSVVNIATRGTVKDNSRRSPPLEDPFLRRFFDVPPDVGPSERQFRSAGSGVVVDGKAGYIITNAHVVENASEITVTTQDNHNFKAEVVGSDTGSDVAVLKLKNPAPLPAITLGDSSNIEVGDFVVAIGNPFGLQHTVTSGIVSGLGRSLGNQNGYEDFIQTDASINLGNSGGALVNLKGELVGINSAILSQTGGSIGIGFAIPVNMVKGVMEQILKYGEVKRGILGVSIYTLTPDLAQAVGAPPDVQGALIAQVQPGSAAEKAGIRINDIVTTVNGKLVHSNAELRNAIGMLRVGDKVEIGLLRDGKPRKVTALIAESGETETAAVDIYPGLEGAELADAPDAGGVTVRDIDPSSPAAQASLRPHDVIVRANRSPVTNLKDLRTAAQGTNSLVLTVRRGNNTILVPMQAR
jgi:serine protease Do/serine protease DegQ